MKIEMTNIHKSFGPVNVLKGVSLSINDAEVHAFMGENGAGKSTTIKVLTGIYTKDEGTIKINGKQVEINKLKDSEAFNIGYVHQELNLVDELSIKDNIYLGKEIKKLSKSGRKLPLLDSVKMHNETEKLLLKLGLKLDPGTIVGKLSIGQKQLVEIAKALSIDAKLIILDEPTSALSSNETEILFGIINDLKVKGVSFLYVSHRMDEIFKICDSVTVLKDGEYVSRENLSEIDENKLISMMVGRSMDDNLIPHLEQKPGSVALEVVNISYKDDFKNVSFSVKKGEILGLYGLIGAGRTDILEAIFGIKQITDGHIKINDKIVNIKSSRDALSHRIAFLTEDRKGNGCIVDFSLENNLNLPSYPKYTNKIGKINYTKSKKIFDTYRKKLGIVCEGGEQPLSDLSGGNQQKVIFGKWIETKPDILLLDEPTRGVDVGAKKEIYDFINMLKKQGVAIILVSSEMPELQGLSDKIGVMHQKRLVKIFDDKKTTSKEEILEYSFIGGKKNVEY